MDGFGMEVLLLPGQLQGSPGQLQEPVLVRGKRRESRLRRASWGIRGSVDEEEGSLRGEEIGPFRTALVSGHSGFHGYALVGEFICTGNGLHWIWVLDSGLYPVGLSWDEARWHGGWMAPQCSGV